MPRALNGSTSMRSIFPVSEKPSTCRPLWSSGADRSEPNATSNRRGTSASGDSASSRTKFSRSRHRPSSSSRRWRSPSSIQTPLSIASERQVPEKGERVVEALGVDALGSELLREPREELEERLVGDRAAKPSVHLGVDRARVDQPLEEPDRRAVGEELELGHGEARLRAQAVDQRLIREAASAARRRRGRARAGGPSRSRGRARAPRREPRRRAS